MVLVAQRNCELIFLRCVAQQTSPYPLPQEYAICRGTNGHLKISTRPVNRAPAAFKIAQAKRGGDGQSKLFLSPKPTYICLTHSFPHADFS